MKFGQHDLLRRCCKAQYSETSVMHILFNLLRIKDLYMFRAFLAHPQEALNIQDLFYCVRVMSVGCTRIGVEIVLSNPGDTKYRLCNVS
jgi:hypothetical protein